MKILIIDDSSYKLEAIKAILQSFDSSYEIDTASCRNVGLRKLLEGYDLLILDNCFPIMEDSAPKKDMGLNVLHDISLSMRFDEIRKNLKIIVCSSDEIDVSDYILFSTFTVSLPFDNGKPKEKSGIIVFGKVLAF